MDLEDIERKIRKIVSNHDESVRFVCVYIISIATHNENFQ